MKCFVALLAVLVAFPSACLAQALADRVPGDAVLYVGSSGTDNLGAGYDQSHLKALLDASRMRDLLNQCLPKMIDRLVANAPPQKAVTQVRDLIFMMAKHPVAIYFGGLDPANEQMPVKMAVLCNAGPDAAVLEGHINDLLAQAGPAPVKITVSNNAGLITLGTVTLNLAGGTLAANKDFQRVMAQTVKDPAFALYIDGAGLTQTIDTGIKMADNPGLAQAWPQIRDGVGLPGLKHIACASGFAGKDWMSVAFVDAPIATRTGVLALFNSPPISNDTLKLIPSSATVASAGIFDLGAAYQAVRKLVAQFAPPPVNQQIDQAIQMANQTVGFNIETDMINAFGPEWALYIDPAAVGNGMLGCTLVNRPRNATALETSLGKLETFANAMIEENLPTDKLTIAARKETVDGVNLHFWGLPVVTPTWAMKDGVWYAGLYPQTVVAAANKSGGKSLLDNPAYQDARKRLNAPDNVASVSFVDLPKITPDGYQGLLMISRIYLGLGDLFGLESPAMVLPPLDKLQAQTTPVCSVAWTDDAGFHVKTVEPFPDSGIITSCAILGPMGTIGMAEGPAMMSVMLPSLNRARETANRVKCASNERQIGQAILLYSNDFKGAYPPDLGTLVKTEDITAEPFICPDSKVTVPAWKAGTKPDEIAAWVNKNSSYIYLGAGKTMGNVDADTIVVYDKPENHHDGANALYGDGHVEYLTTAALKQQLAKQGVHN